jgi:hypothetical protein
MNQSPDRSAPPAEAREAAEAATDPTAPCLSPGFLTDKPRRGVMRGNKEQITVTLPPEMIARLEQLGRKAGMARTQLITLFIHRGLEAGL